MRRFTNYYFYDYIDDAYILYIYSPIMQSIVSLKQFINVKILKYIYIILVAVNKNSLGMHAERATPILINQKLENSEE